ncbi:MAG: lysine--tRNA ligase [Firmicutes bacterium]|nr:lysine--tRNA ligase [Bacillota bacterium]
MHWSDEIAQRIIAKRPDKEEYVCAAGISPSGSIHIGNFRDIATSYFVCKALERAGKKARLLFSWDELDRLRKVPKNVAAVTEGFEQYIGKAYVDVPNPFGEEGTYAEYFEKEFLESIKAFHIDMDFKYQAEMYRSGKYKEHIITALDKRAEIFDILDSFRTQDAEEGEKERYYPTSIYCPECGKDTTTITAYDDETKVAEYTCQCGHHGTFDFKTEHNCKLAWKVDWAMRWLYEGVDFEPGGKDHASPGGSYDTSKVIAKKIFGIDAPEFQGYEFIGIKGVAGKMSGSSGLNMTPETLLQFYQPEVILWLYSKSEPTKAFDFCFDDGILRQYFEFDKQYNEYKAGTASEFVQTVIENCINETTDIKTVPMSLLAQLGSIVDFNVPMMETVFEKINQPFKFEDFEQRLNLAKNWLEKCAPDQANTLRATRDWDLYESLDDDQKKELEMLHDYIKTQEYDLDTLNAQLYAIPKKIYGEDREDIKKLQREFFKIVYKLLIAKEKGPRLYLFLYAIDKERYLNLLDFSTPKTEAELNPVVEEEVEAKPERVYGDPDPVKPIEDEITIDDFFKVDLRVCKIIKCQEIRKAHRNYKITVNDGLKERVIVSSIKEEYEPEELIGKKIIVVANLKPARLTGVQSEGMLVAATNNACGCKVIFVDDMVPEGTRIC